VSGGWASPRNRQRRLSRLIPATRTARLTKLRLQIMRGIRNAGAPQTAVQLVPWCFGRVSTIRDSHHYAIRRAAGKVCVRAGRARTRGRPVLWDLREEVRELSLWGLRRWLRE
jgi:hypothetical protein